MNTSKLIWIDKYLGRFSALLLNAVVRLVGKILRIDHRLNRPYQRIVICKFKGMGSIIQATPLLQSLRKQYPDAQLVFVTSQANRPIVESCGLVDELFVLKDHAFFPMLGSCISLVFSFWKKRPDLYLDLEIYSNFSSIIATLSLATNRIGFYLRSSHYRMGLYTHMMFFNTKAPISEVYLQMFRALSDETSSIRQLSELHGSAQAHELERDKLIIVNVNASDLREERAWPEKQFAQLIQQLVQDHPEYKIALIGSKSEEARVLTVLNSCPPHERLVNLAGKTSIPELIRLIQHASLLITNDTGPMHIGFASRTKTVALFGPCSPQQYGYHPHCYPIYKNVYCSPCVHEFEVPPCKGHNECMKLIEVQEVRQLVSNVLSGQHTEAATFEHILYQSDNLPQKDFPILGFVCR
ncbi:MAG: glycosyltransferase family 9 protein [Bacteroidetes bacterium]|nr:MAG: glycosyltransferase family 9 protein [Bacteroidota bacterium]